MSEEGVSFSFKIGQVRHQIVALYGEALDIDVLPDERLALLTDLANAIESVNGAIATLRRDLIES